MAKCLLVTQFAFLWLATIASAQNLTISIETRILDFDPQAGMKSTHKIQVNIDKTSKSVRIKDYFETGTTSVFGYSLSSVRNNFLVQDLNYHFGNDVEISFSTKGQTGSGVRLTPNINYNFAIRIVQSLNGAHVYVDGCHDGYPAYIVRFDDGYRSGVAYQFSHKSMRLLNLFGDCDTKATSATSFGTPSGPLSPRP